MKYKLIFVCIFCYNFVLPLQYVYSSDIKDKVVADSLLKEKKYNQAITEYKRLLFWSENETFYSSSYWNLGVCYAHLNQFAPAIEMFNKSILYSNIDSLKHDRQLNLGMYYLKNHDYEKAKVLFLQITRENDYILFLRGTCFLFNFETEKCKYLIDSYYPGSLSTHSMNYLMDFYNKQINLELVSSKKAVILSSIFPGSGQFYCGRRLNGIHSFILNFIFIYLSVNSFSEKEYLQGFAFTFIFSRFYVRNIINAKTFAYQHNENIKTQFINDMRSSLSFIIGFEIPLYF